MYLPPHPRQPLGPRVQWGQWQALRPSASTLPELTLDPLPATVLSGSDAPELVLDARLPCRFRRPRAGAEDVRGRGPLHCRGLGRGRLGGKSIGSCQGNAFGLLQLFLLAHGWWVAAGKQVGIQVQSQDLNETGLHKIYHIWLASGFLLVSFFPAVLGSLFTLLT